MSERVEKLTDQVVTDPEIGETLARLQELLAKRDNAEGCNMIVFAFLPAPPPHTGTMMRTIAPPSLVADKEIWFDCLEMIAEGVPKMMSHKPN